LLMLDSKFLLKFKTRIIKEFIDIIILGRLRIAPSSGYDIIRYIYQKNKVLISSGTIYTTLYSLEREGLIEGRSKGRKRIYRITSKGLDYIEALFHNSEKVLSFLWEVLRETSPHDTQPKLTV